MKKRRFVSLALGLAMLLPGCSGSTENEYMKKIDTALSDARVKDIDSFSSLGYVSKSSDSQNTKSRIKNAYREDLSSNQPYYLAGLVGDEIKGLDLTSGESSWNIPISDYADLGMFIRFCPENSIWRRNEKGNHEEEITPDDPRYWGHSLTSIQGYGSDGFVGNQAANYLLSKESGNIYCLSKGDVSKDPCIQFSGYIIGSNILYGALYTENDFVWSIVSEEDGKLKIEKSDMLNFILGGKSEFNEGNYQFDKYGNILAGNKIYGYSQKTLTPDFGSDLTYEFDSYLGIIYTFYQGAFYVLEGLEFKKYNGVIFGQILDQMMDGVIISMLAMKKAIIKSDTIALEHSKRSVFINCQIKMSILRNTLKK